jgi:hypothetical protein
MSLYVREDNELPLDQITESLNGSKYYKEEDLDGQIW